jgi:hypothetical protein
LIGLWDLFVHSAALCILIFMFGQTPRLMTDESSRQLPSPYVDVNQGSTLDKSFQASNIYLNRLIQRSNTTHSPMEIPTRNVYAHMNLMTIKWAQSLNQRMFKYIFYSQKIYINRF